MAHNAESRRFLCGWGPQNVTPKQHELFVCGQRDDTAGRYSTPFFIANQAETGEGKSARLWKDVRSVTGQNPDLVPQPTGNCVACGAEHAIEGLSAGEIAAGELEKWRPQFNPWGYYAGRVLVGKNRLKGSAGSIGSWQAEAHSKYGSLAADIPGLPRYDKASVDAWGDGRAAGGISPTKFTEMAAANKIGVWGILRDWSQVRDALYHRFGVTTASNQGYNMKASGDGFHARSGNWPHQMCVYGYSEEGRIPWVAIYNSWGDVHGIVRDPDTGEEWPRGLLCVKRDDFIRGHLTPQAECCVLSAWDGYPAKYDWKRIVHGRKSSKAT